MVFPTPLRFPLTSVPDDFGRILRAERLERRWTQMRLAKAAGLERETVARLEAGLRRPSADTVFRLTAALDLETGELVPAWPEWEPVGLNTMGARSRARRRELGLSLFAVAEKAGVSAATLSRFEREFQWASKSLLAVSPGEVANDAATNLAMALGFSNSAEHVAWCTGI